MHIPNELPNLWDVLEICSKSVTLVSDDFNRPVFQYTLYLSCLHHLFLVFCFFFSPKNSSSLHFQTQWAALFCCFISCFLSLLSQSRSLPLSRILFSFMTLLAGNILGLKLTVLLVCDLSTAFGVQILPLQCFKSVNQVQN